MSACRFAVFGDNPNEGTGGAGCLCHPRRQPDQAGPFAVFPGNDMEDIKSPHVVLCLGCAEHFVEIADGEQLKASQDVEGTAVDVTEE